RTVSSLSLLDDGERAQLQTWNETKREYPRAGLGALFAAQAARTPQATALTFGDERLTYAEVDARANQLAHYLRRLGVGPDVRVGICLERSVEVVVGVLAIAKAGGAYVPLDPEYPAEAVPQRAVARLAFGRSYVEVTPSDVVLQFAPVSFDASTFELWTTLLNGAQLAIAPPGLLSLEELGGFVRERGVTTLWLTAPLFL